jgi:uncharacterized membrane protein
MNPAHLHLIFNHLPIMGMIFSLLVLLAGFLLKNRIVKLTALGLYVVTALTALPAFFSGEGAEEAIEHLAGVSHDLIEHHEDEGKLFLITCLLTGAAALLAFWLDRKNHRLAPSVLFGVLALGIAGIATGQMAGTSGGYIRHPEIRKDGGVQPASPAQQEAEEEEGH